MAVQKEAGRGFYLHGHLPVFQHEEQDVRSFRMLARQMIEGGTVKPKQIVKRFGVPMITVKRYVKLYRDRGSKGFYEAKPRHSSASVLKAEVLEQAQRLVQGPRAHWFTMVFDREGYSPELFEQMRNQRVAILRYRKLPGDDGRREEFTSHSVTLAGGETVTMQLAERGSQLSNRLWLREIRKLTESGHHRRHMFRLRWSFGNSLPPY